jgi:uncharacterized membrane protein
LNKLLGFIRTEPFLFIWFVFVVFVYSTISLFKYWHFLSGFDLGIIDQAIWHYSRFEKPACTVNPFSNLLGDHFHPLLAVLAPLYWVFPKVEILLVAQDFFFILPVFPVFIFVNKRLGRLAGYFFSISYSIFWGVQTASTFEFHEVSLAVPLIAFAVYFIDEEKWRLLLLDSFLLMLVKEDMCLLSMFLGFCLILKRHFKIGLALAAASFLIFLFELKVLIPFFSDAGKYNYWERNYSQLGAGPMEAVKMFFTHPLRIVTLLFSDPRKIKALLCIFAPFLMAPLFSPYGILLIPLVCERMLSSNVAFWVVNNESHYTAVISPLVIMAAADGLFNAFKYIGDSRNKRKWIGILAAVILILNISISLLPRFPLRKFIRPSFFKFSDAEKAGPEILSLIPKEAGVLCQDSILPHLTHRKIVVDILLDKFITDKPIDVLSGDGIDCIVACKYLPSFYEDHEKEIRDRIEIMKRKGFRSVYDEKGWIILKK